MKKDQLTSYHEFVWHTLTSLEDGEKILGESLMAHAGIKDRRHFYQVINDLRKIGMLVGSSKHQDTKGYYEIRDINDFERWAIPNRKAIEELLLIERCMTESFEASQRVIASEDDKDEDKPA